MSTANTPSVGQNTESTLRLAQVIGSFKLPVALTLGIVLLSFVPRIAGTPLLQWSFWGAAAALALWQGFMLLHLARRPALKDFSSAVYSQHYVQAMVQFSVYLYWGYYWRPVYDHLWLLAGQVLFAYTFGMLLAWSRRRSYRLGFGPIPIIFSTNLFLWFHDEWFYMQFVMIAVGFLGKEFVRWQRDGRSVHIFNPSAFSLGFFSMILIFTGTTDLTWAPEISSTLTLAPGIYTYLFAVGLVVMYFFKITLVSGAAAMTLFGFSALYAAVAGVPYFLDSEIPAAVFLGLHLLITDPSTSPRTPLGKTLFGILYGIGVFALYTILGYFGEPTLYDKLLCVPLLNLSVIAIDRLVRRFNSESLLNLWNPAWLGGRGNLAHMAVWIGVFSLMSLLGRTDAQHPGDSVPFWEESCAADLPNACTRLISVESTYCGDSAAWACNELGAHYREGRIVKSDPDLAFAYFARACELKLQAGCANLLDEQLALRANPLELDLRLMLRQGGKNLMDASVPELYDRACRHDWAFACARSGGASAGGD